MIYHICRPEAWQEAQQRSQYTAPSLTSEGFIHCSARHQLLSVIRAFYAEADRLLLLCIDEKRLNAELRWEAPAHPQAADILPESASPFPHIYGPLNLEAVVKILDLPKSARGFALPPELA